MKTTYQVDPKFLVNQTPRELTFWEIYAVHKECF